MNRARLQRAALIAAVIGVLWYAADFPVSPPWVLLILFPAWFLGTLLLWGLGGWRLRQGRHRARQSPDLADHAQFYLDRNRLRWRALPGDPGGPDAGRWTDPALAALGAAAVLGWQAGYVGSFSPPASPGLLVWSVAAVTGLLLALAAMYRRWVLLPGLIAVGEDLLVELEPELVDCARHFETVIREVDRLKRKLAPLGDLELDDQLRTFDSELRAGRWFDCLYEKRWTDCHALLDRCEEELGRLDRLADERLRRPPPDDPEADEDYAPLTLERACQILNARPGSSPEQLARIVKNLRQAYHPDQFPEEAEKRHYDRLLARVNQAYQFILDHGF